MTNIEKLLIKLASFDDVATASIEIHPPPDEHGDWHVSCGFVSAHGMDLHEALSGAIEEAKDKRQADQHRGEFTQNIKTPRRVR
jgi:hypothetical protein